VQALGVVQVWVPTLVAEYFMQQVSPAVAQSEARLQSMAMPLEQPLAAVQLSVPEVPLLATTSQQVSPEAQFAAVKQPMAKPVEQALVVEHA
jgi:hypothetical protein